MQVYACWYAQVAREYTEVYLAGHHSDLFSNCIDQDLLKKFRLCPLWLRVPWTRFLYLNTANGNHRLLAVGGLTFDDTCDWMQVCWLHPLNLVLTDSSCFVCCLQKTWTFRTGIDISVGWIQFDGSPAGPNLAGSSSPPELLKHHPEAGVHYDLVSLWNSLGSEHQKLISHLVFHERAAAWEENENELRNQATFNMCSSIDRYWQGCMQSFFLRS